MRESKKAAAEAAGEGADDQAGLVTTVHQVKCRAREVQAQYRPDLPVFLQA
jgi:hypothetical protein